MIKPSKHKIVLICGNAQRELSMLQLLKKEFEDTLNANVWIIGSIADVQKIYYLLYKIRPNMVFISQIVEKVTRDIAYYVRQSGAILCVLPVELYYLKNEYRNTFKKQSYNEYLDYYFLPGENMYNDTLILSDIRKSKMLITGTPRVDLYINKKAKNMLSREEFCRKYFLKRNSKNIFVFTSFIVTSLNYIKKEKAFEGELDYILKRNNGMLEMRSLFIRDIKKICTDFPDCNVILKLHPLEENFFCLEKNPNNLRVIKDISFNDTVRSIDLAVYWRSTIATECWVNDIRTLQYIPVNNHESLRGDFNEENPIYYKYSELRRGISKYLLHKFEKKYLLAQKRYLQVNYYKIDGLAVKRIAKKVKKILLKVNDGVLDYKFANDKGFCLFVFFEKIFGVRLSRRLISVFKKNYSWRYAVDNYVFKLPANNRN